MAQVVYGIIGFIIGCLVGITVMCCLIVAKESDRL